MFRFIALTIVVLVASASVVRAETVELDHQGIALLGDLEGAVDSEHFVVLVHGTLSHKDMELIQVLQSALLDRGVSSLAVSLSLGENRREGMFDCTHLHHHLMSDAVDEIGAWMTWLEGRRTAPVILLGHSRGGAQVAWYGAQHPHPLIKGLVLMAPAYEESMDDRVAHYHERFGGDLGKVVREARALVAAGKGDGMMDLPGFIYCPETKASAVSVVSYYDDDERRDSPTMVARSTLPILVIVGTEDRVVPLVASKYQEISRDPRVRLETIDGAGHFFLDFYAEDAADLISDFQPDA